MFQHYLAALLSLRRAHDLAHSALPDAPVQPHREGRRRGRNRRKPVSTAPNLSLTRPPADAPVAAGSNGSSDCAPCPCRQWGVVRGDRHGCVALAMELFPQLDRELDAWEAAHGWLYR